MEIPGTSCLVRRRRIAILMLIIQLLLTALLLPRTAQAQELPEANLQPIVEALRGAGRHLFANALQTSPVRGVVVSGNSLTLFAPPDGDLYQLDVSLSSADDYSEAVKRHIVIPKLSYYDLNRLQAESRLHTLAENETLAVTASPKNSNIEERVMIDGARISVPDLYFDGRISIQGVDRVLNGTASPPPDAAQGFWPTIALSESPDLNPWLAGVYAGMDPLPTVLPKPGQGLADFVYELEKLSAMAPLESPDRFPPSPSNGRTSPVIGRADTDGAKVSSPSPASLKGHHTHSESKRSAGRSHRDESPQNRQRHPKRSRHVSHSDEKHVRTRSFKT